MVSEGESASVVQTWDTVFVARVSVATHCAPPKGKTKEKERKRGKGAAHKEEKGLECLIVTGVESPEQCQCERKARRLERYAPRQPAKRIQVWWKSEAEVVNSPSWDRRSPSERRCRSSRASPPGDVLLSQSCGQCTTVRVVSL